MIAWLLAHLRCELFGHEWRVWTWEAVEPLRVCGRCRHIETVGGRHAEG